MAGPRAFDRTVRILRFDVLPQVTQITCGGGPLRINKSTKSLSLLITTAPAARAASKIASSDASPQTDIPHGDRFNIWKCLSDPASQRR